MTPLPERTPVPSDMSPERRALTASEAAFYHSDAVNYGRRAAKMRKDAECPTDKADADALEEAGSAMLVLIAERDRLLAALDAAEARATESERDNKYLRGLLKGAKCPDCDGSGGIQGHAPNCNGECQHCPEVTECEWYHYRSLALAALAAPAADTPNKEIK